MENYIIKFKKGLKSYQSYMKSLIKECDQELSLIKKLIDGNMTTIRELKESGTENISKKLHIAVITYSFKKTVTYTLDDIINDIFNVKKKKKRKVEFENIEVLYDELDNFTSYLKQEYNITQNIINAFENDKIKDPINNIEELYERIKYTSLTTEEISRIIGMAISFNSQYAKRNKKHKIKNIDIIDALAEYYNLDGTFKYNEDSESFENLMLQLFENYDEQTKLFNLIVQKEKKFSIKELVILLKENNHKIKNKSSMAYTQEKEENTEDYSLSPETIKALQELRKYYKNGTIIEIPEDIDKFYQTLNATNLDELEKKYIISLINDKILSEQKNIISKYLSQDEQEIYEKAINLLNSFNHSNSDTDALKQFIEELQTIIEILQNELDENDKEYLQKEISTIIEQLSIICDKYNIEDEKSSNKYIFLLDKEGIPYIYSDIDALDPIYRKAVYSLIPKIDKNNQSSFKKILSNEEFAYKMYEVTSPRAHVAFVEVDEGIYVIVGANIPRNGYRELNNRLKANQLVIKQIENAVKNPQTRNKILKSNEEYLISSSEQTQNNSNKLTLKPRN